MHLAHAALAAPCSHYCRQKQFIPCCCWIRPCTGQTLVPTADNKPICLGRDAFYCVESWRGQGREARERDPSPPSPRLRGVQAAAWKGRSGDCSVPDPVVAELALLGLVQVNGAGWCLVQIRRGRGSGHLIIRLLIARGGTDRSCKESAGRRRSARGRTQRGRAGSSRGRAAGKGRGWAAAASAPCPVFTTAAAVNNACPEIGRAHV